MSGQDILVVIGHFYFIRQECQQSVCNCPVDREELALNTALFVFQLYNWQFLQFFILLCLSGNPILTLQRKTFKKQRNTSTCVNRTVNRTLKVNQSNCVDHCRTNRSARLFRRIQDWIICLKTWLRYLKRNEKFENGLLTA